MVATERTRVEDPSTEPVRISRPTGNVAAVTAAVTVTAFAMAVATPPRSGPNCTEVCITAPYTDAAAWVPRDYLWIYPAVLSALCVVVLMVCLHHDARSHDGRWSGVAVAMAGIGAGALTVDYALQLGVMQPSLLAGETDGLSLISMYNPHGVFLALEDLGYLLLAVSFAFVGLEIVGHSGLVRAIRWILIGGGLTVIVALLALAPVHGTGLVVPFELLAIAVDWTVVVVVGLLLTIRSRRA